MIYNNPENLSPQEVIDKLSVLTLGVIMSVGTTVNREKRIKVLESYGLPVKISKMEWKQKFCKN